MGFFFIFDEEIFPQFKGNGEKKKNIFYVRLTSIWLCIV